MHGAYGKVGMTSGRRVADVQAKLMEQMAGGMGGMGGMPGMGGADFGGDSDDEDGDEADAEAEDVVEGKGKGKAAASVSDQLSSHFHKTQEMIRVRAQRWQVPEV